MSELDAEAKDYEWPCVWCSRPASEHPCLGGEGISEYICTRYVPRERLELQSTPVPVPPRQAVLEEAAELITGDRNQTYGSPTQNFTDTARTWSVLLRPKLKDGAELEPGDVAMLMVALKLARMVAQPKRDNWVDIAGYAGCGYEADVESGRIKE